MARKMMAALALVALLSTAACNSSMGPASDSTGGISTIEPGGPKPPADFDKPDDLSPGDGQGGGPGAAEPIRSRRLVGGSTRLPQEITPGSGEDSGGDNGPIGHGTNRPDRRRGTGNVTPHP